MRYDIYSNSTNGFFGIHSVGYAEDPKVTRFGPGCREEYIIHYVLDGEGVYNGNKVKKGQGFLIYPGQRQFYYPDRTSPWRFLWIIADGDMMRDAYARYDADPETLIFTYGSGSVLSQSAKYIVENNNKTEDQAKLAEFYLHILNSHIANTDKSKRKSNSDAYTDFCVNYIEKNIHKKITVNELTELLGVSQPYLYKIFFKRYNMSVKEYIIWSKHNRAKHLLANTELSITEVANSAGYDDSLVFSKMFKAKEGVSPTEFRKHAALDRRN